MSREPKANRGPVARPDDRRALIAAAREVFSESGPSEPADRVTRSISLRRGFHLEWITLGWNAVGVVILADLAITSSSVALAGFGLDSVIEIGASVVVLWELSGTGEDRQRRALRLIGVAFAALAIYLTVQSTVALVTGHRVAQSAAGIAWTGITAVVMFLLAAGKGRTGRALGNPVLVTEARITFIDGLLAVAVLLGLATNFAFGWWWADPVAGFVIAYYAIREVVQIFTAGRAHPG